MENLWLSLNINKRQILSMPSVNFIEIESEPQFSAEFTAMSLKQASNGFFSARTKVSSSLQLQDGHTFQDCRCTDTSMAGVLTDPIPCHP